MGLEEVLARSEVALVLGSGGVGKTTSAAALGVAAAEMGREAVVVTIDPARRLGEAFGGELQNEPVPVEVPGAPGSVEAAMLDPAATFDGLVREYAPDPDRAEALLSNPFYLNVSRSLSGVHEYMATERLYQLVQSGRYDLVVVDTPPSQQAIDFLDAPDRMVRFLNHRMYRALAAPGRFAVRTAGMAGRALAGLLSGVVGGQVVEDVAAFFAGFEGMEKGFASRAAATEELLRSPTTARVLVTRPTAAASLEAADLVSEMSQRLVAPTALVLNMCQSDPGPVSPRLAAPSGSALADLLEAHDTLCALHAAEQDLIAVVGQAVGEVPSAEVPLVGADVHDLDALVRVADHLIGRASLP